MIVVVPCGARKHKAACMAGAMYTGPYSRACKAYALSVAPPWQVYILSAKYGLLALTDEIEPYNLRMGQKGCVTAATVRKQAEQRGLLNEDVVALGGTGYTQVCRQVWPSCKTPLASVGGMGKQLAWLKRNKKGPLRGQGALR